MFNVLKWVRWHLNGRKMVNGPACGKFKITACQMNNMPYFMAVNPWLRANYIYALLRENGFPIAAVINGKALIRDGCYIGKKDDALNDSVVYFWGEVNT